MITSNQSSCFTSPSAILFDFDGTLVDSEPVHLACWQHVLSRFHADLDQSLYRRLCYGATIFESARALCDHLQLDTPPDALAAAKSRRLLTQLQHTPFAPMQGAEVLLKRVRDCGIQAALVTGSRRSEVNFTLTSLGWGELFQTRVTLDDVSRGKPSPESYQLALAQLGLSGENCIALEDSATGCKAAVAAGLTTFSVHADEIQQQAMPGAAGHFACLSDFSAGLLDPGSRA